MRKITLLICMSLLSLCGYSQLAPEGFEGAWPPAGWGVYDNGTGTNYTWAQSIAGNLTQPPYEGDHAAYLRDETAAGGTPQDWLITPQFTAPANPQLRFYSRLTQNLDQGGIYRVMISEDPVQGNLSEYTLVQEWTELEINPLQQSYNEILVSLPESTAGQQIYVAFVMEANGADRWLIDNVSVNEQCLDPENPQATNIGATTALLTWENPGGADSWEIELLPVTLPTTGTGEPYNGDPSYLAEGLTPNTDYKYFVRAVCDNGPSAWAGPVFFTTVGEGDTCEAAIPIGLPFSTTDNTSNYGNNYDGLPGGDSCGNNGAYFLQGNDVVYEFTAAFSGIISFNLNADSNTGVFVYDDCDDIGTECVAGSVTPWTGTFTSIPEFAITEGQTYYILISSQPETTAYNLIIQQVTCDPPVGLPVENTGFTSAELSWTNPTGADAWEIVVQEAGTGIPQGSGEPVNINTNYPADGLEPATLYEYYVRADCNDGTFSAWAGPYLFNTTICDASEQCEYTFIMSNYSGNGWLDNTMTVSQSGITMAVLAPQFDFGTVELTTTVALCPGIPVQIYWNAGGWDPHQIGLTVKNASGQTVYAKPAGEGGQDSLLYEGEVICGIACLPPNDLTAQNVTFTTADLGWDGPTTGEWEYYVTEAGGPAPDEDTPVISTATNPVTAEDLTAGTNYEFYVRMVCDDEGTVSDWSEPFPFSTGFCLPENQCDCTFVMSSEWGSGYAGHTMTISQDGIIVATIGSDFITGEEMSVTVPLCTGFPFEVYWNGTGFGGGIGLSIVNSFEQTIYSMDGTETPNNIIYSGEVDCSAPACIPPADLTAENATMTTIDLEWEGLLDGSWEYYIVEAGEPAPTPGTDGEPTLVNPVTAGGLNPATNYEYYVRMICPGGTFTEWSGPVAFNTTVCEPDDQCLFTFEMTSEVGWGWEGHTMTISQGGVVVATIDDSENSGTVQVPLCPDIDIEIFWNEGGWGNPNDKGLVVYNPYLEEVFSYTAGTGEQGTVLFTGAFSCEAPPCPKPQDLAATDITATSALLTWTEMGSATAWEIVVLPIGSPEPTGAGTPVTENSYPAEGLATGVAYQFYVRSVCGEEGNSTWSGPFAFYTPLENNDCGTATTIPVNQGMECIEYVSAVMNGATSTGITSSCTWTSPLHDVWFEFEATHENHGIRISNQHGEVLPFHAVYSGECGAQVEIACNYESGGSTLNNLIPGHTYWIQVYIDGGMSEINSIVSFDICVYTPVGGSIILDQEPTVEEIVNEVLISSNCGQVSNITSNTGTDHGVGSNGIAYFNRGTTNFPLEEGILLTSGNAMQALGPNMTTMGNGSLGEGDYWPGDDQLFAYLQDQGLPSISLLQATIVEFDFVPVTDHIKFPFIFASEEYNGTDQCLRSDAFAFFLSTGGEEPINLAVVPETTVPVTSMTIRDAAYLDPSWEFSCESENPLLFDKYYGPHNGLDPMTAPMNFNGHTVIMMAEADVIPGQTYHIKMVIADEYTTALDSGVFIGAFDIGNVDLGLDLTVEAGSALCAGEEFTIESGLDAELYNITWLQDGEVMEGETGASLTVAEVGEYTIEVQYLETTCGGSDSVIIEYYPSVEAATQNPNDLTICAAGATAQFNLAQNDAVIAGVNAGEYAITYHASAADAETGDGDLTSPYENTSNPQSVYARVEDAETGCYFIYSFTLSVTPEYTADVLTDVTECDLYTLPELSANNNYYTGPGGTGTALNAGESIIESQLIYIFAQDAAAPGCSDESSFTVTIIPTPLIETISEGCDGSAYVLEVVFDADEEFYNSGNTTIEWRRTEGGDIIATGPTLTVTETGMYHARVIPEGATVCYYDIAAEVESTVCGIPKGISPNGDEFNQGFDLTALDVRKLSIYNRYGAEVYSFSGAYTKQWEGQGNNGDELPTGTYFYMIERANGESKTGWVYLNREE